MGKARSLRRFLSDDVVNRDSGEVIDSSKLMATVDEKKLREFEEMKGTLDTRPMRVYTREHIYAHLLTCMIALTMVRLIQHRYLGKNPPAKDDPRQWTYGIPGERIQRALNRWRAIQTGEDGYWFADIDDPDLSAILGAYGIKIPKKQYSYGEMKRMKKDIKVF